MLQGFVLLSAHILKEVFLVTFFGPWNIGRLLGDTFGTYSKKWYYYIAIATSFTIASMLVAWALAPTIAEWWDLINTYGETDPAIFRPLFIYFCFTLLQLLISMIIDAAMYCPFLHTIGQQYTTGNISIGRAFGAGAKRVVSVLLAVMLRSIVVGALAITLIGIPLAIYFYIKWQFITHAILFEGKSITEALSRSSELTRDNWWRVLGYVIVLLIIVFAFGFVMGFIQEFMLDVFHFTTVVNGFDFFFAIIEILVAPIFVIATTLLYFTLRVEKERYHLGKLKIDIDAWSVGERPVYTTDVLLGQFYCSKCGTKQTAGSRFCTNCGRSFYEDTTTPRNDDDPQSGDEGGGPFIS